MIKNGQVLYLVSVTYLFRSASGVDTSSIDVLVSVSMKDVDDFLARLDIRERGWVVTRSSEAHSSLNKT